MWNNILRQGVYRLGKENGAIMEGKLQEGWSRSKRNSSLPNDRVQGRTSTENLTLSPFLFWGESMIGKRIFLGIALLLLALSILSLLGTAVMAILLRPILTILFFLGFLFFLALAIIATLIWLVLRIV